MSATRTAAAPAVAKPELGLLIQARHHSLEQFWAELNIYLSARMIADRSNIPGIVEIILCVGSLERVAHHALLIAQQASPQAQLQFFGISRTGKSMLVS
jgi:phosphate uptake regulator